MRGGLEFHGIPWMGGTTTNQESTEAMGYRLVWAQKLSLAALSGYASGDTFLIQNRLFEKVSYIHSYVVRIFCITIASSISDDAGSDTCSIPKISFRIISNTNSYVVSFFVLLSLAALLDDASGDTFLIQNHLFEKVSYTNSYVVPRFCITIASSIIG